MRGWLNSVAAKTHAHFAQVKVLVLERAKHTLCIRHMLDDIAIFDDLDHATDESLRSLGCVVDCYEGVRTLGRSGHCSE